MSINTCVLALSCGIALFGLNNASAETFDLFTGFTVGQMKSDNKSGRTTMNGWNASITGYPHYRFGLTADFAGYYGSAHPATTGGDSVSVQQYSFMAGPQVRLLRRHRFETSFKALFGGANGRASSYNVSETTFAALFGSNIDVTVSRRVAIRFSPGMYLTQFGSQTQRNFRFSIGPVFRLGGSEE